jgi:hypothetical protein
MSWLFPSVTGEVPLRPSPTGGGEQETNSTSKGDDVPPPQGNLTETVYEPESEVSSVAPVAPATSFPSRYHW